jgi:hypothetical protein
MIATARPIRGENGRSASMFVISIALVISIAMVIRKGFAISTMVAISMVIQA